MIFAFAQYTIFSQLNAPGGPGVSLIQQCIWACRFSRKGYYSLSWQPRILPSFIPNIYSGSGKYANIILCVMFLPHHCSRNLDKDYQQYGKL